MREVWVITACLALIDATSSHYNDGLVAPDLEKEFYRLLGDLYSLARVKVECFNLIKMIKRLSILPGRMHCRMRLQLHSLKASFS